MCSLPRRYKENAGDFGRIVEGNGQDGDIELLLELADTISATALCGLGKAAAFPVVSTIRILEKNMKHIFMTRDVPQEIVRSLKPLLLMLLCAKAAQSVQEVVLWAQ